MVRVEMHCLIKRTHEVCRCAHISDKNAVGNLCWLKCYKSNGAKLFRKTMTAQLGKTDEPESHKAFRVSHALEQKGCPTFPC